MRFGTLPLAALRRRHGDKWTRFERDVIPAWVADMDFALAPPIRECLARALERHDFGYPMHASRDPLPQVFAERMPAVRFSPPQSTCLAWLDFNAPGPSRATLTSSSSIRRAWA